MEHLFLLLLIVLMAAALGSGYPVAFALPGSSIIAILIAAGCGYLFAGDMDAYFAYGGPDTWLSAGVTNLRGVYWEPDRDTLIAIPLFIFMGLMLQRSKIAEDLLMTMAQLFGPVPGGLGISVVFVGALLAATTGIVGATVVAMGLISLPAMLRNNYSPALASGTIAASGTLGQIIPPSIVLIILADQLASAADQGNTIRKALYKASTGELSMPSVFDVTSTSAGEMFLGAFLPGLVLVGLYMVFILVVAFIKPKLAPPVVYEGKFDVKFAGKVFMTLVPPLALIFLVLGSIIGGVATVNQAGAIGAAGALLMAGYRLRDGHPRAYWPAFIAIASLLTLVYVIFNYSTNLKGNNDPFGVGLAIFAVAGLVVALVWSGIRALRIENTLHGVMVETAKSTTLVFIILLGAAILTAAFRAFGGEDLVREFLNGLSGGFWVKFIIVMGVIFFLGFFLDFIEIAVVVVPIVAPILLADPGANITAVWLGVMIGLNIQTSFLTPPFGFALFYLRGVAPKIVKTIQIYKGVIPFIGLQLVALVIVGTVPELVNYLPNRVNLTAETASPPRNPRLQYCLEEYVIGEYQNVGANVTAAVEKASKLDLSYLPKNLSKPFEKSLGNVKEVRSYLDLAKEAERTIEVESADYRPIFTEVRKIQRKIHHNGIEIKALERSITRLNEVEEQPAKEELLAEVVALKANSLELEKQIPESWDNTYKDFSNFTKAEKDLRRKYRRGVDDIYDAAALIEETIASNAAFNLLESELKAMVNQANLVAPSEMVLPLKELARKFATIKGASKIKSALSSARRDFKKKKPKLEKAKTNLDKALKEYSVQKSWRAKAEEKLGQPIAAYLNAIRTTIGLRKQVRMTREQALFVASCKSAHRDISLNF